LLTRNGERPATDCTVNGALKVNRTGKREEPSTLKHPQSSSTAVRAELTGSDACTSAGITARGNAPALLLCRQLLAQGLDPDRALEPSEKQVKWLRAIYRRCGGTDER
jgi:hypothetical protein